MKKGSKKRVGRVGKFDIKKTPAFRLLMIGLIVLFVLVIVWIFVYESIMEGGRDLEGELGTLCIFCGENKVVLKVLNYSIASYNQGIYVDINWSGGNISSTDFNSIFIKFIKPEGDCNSTVASPGLDFGENKTYNFIVEDCDTGDFANVTGVEAYAEVNIHMLQVGLIENITIYDNDILDDIIDLNSYFYCLSDIKFGIVENPNNVNIELGINQINNLVTVISLNRGWYGTQKFNLNAECGSDVLDINNMGENMTFYIMILNETRPVAPENNPPEFDEDGCAEFVWEENTNYTIDMDHCWDDEDEDDVLEYRYGALDDYEENISIIELSGNKLKFVPNASFVGRTYFYIWANDSYEEVKSEKIYIEIYEPVVNDTNVSTPAPVNPKIKSSSPISTSVSLFPDTNKTFSITAENYENIKWYLNGVLTQGVTGLSYEFEGLSEGEHVIKVEIINGTKIDSKTWRIIIEEEEYMEERVFDIGTVIFYLIIAVVVVVIFLVIWLFIIEKNKGGKRIDVGFGISGVKKKGRKSDLNYLNIPHS